LLNPSSPTQTQLSGAFSTSDSYSVYFGAPPALPASQVGSNVSVQDSNTISVTAPPGTKPGPANVTLTRPDGWWGVMPDAASYGPTFLYADPAAGPTAGGSSVLIYGYGFVSTKTQVTIGGSPATITQVSGPGFLSPYPFPLDTIELKTPAGNSGPADITITTPSGSTTATGGFQYLASAHVYPVTGALDALIYDQQRKRLYVTNQDHNCVEVFDLASSSFLAPIPVGNKPTGLALTPDDSMLAVVNMGDGTVSVIDPSKMQVIATYPVLTSTDQAGAAVATQIAPVEPHRMLVELVNTSTLNSGTLHLLNLDNGSLSCAGVVACDSTGFNIDFDSGLEAMASTSDGSEVFLADFSQVSAQPVGWLNFVTNTLTTAPILAAHDDAVDRDGNLFMASINAFNQKFFNTGVLSDVTYLDAGGGDANNVNGEKLNPSGSLLFIPQHTPTNGSQSGVDIFDVHRGRLAMRVALPEQIPFCLNALALDETGTKMFLISTSGITVAQLAQAPLSIATVNPSSGTAGAQVTIRGSGFQSGATVTFGTIKEVTTYVDSETLKTTVPSLAAGPVRVTVTNPDGKSYSFDAAFTEN
jgi:YVTN family beta-propeller protein